LQSRQGIGNDHQIVGLRIHRDDGATHRAVVVVKTRGSGASIAPSASATKPTSASEATTTAKAAKASASALLG
jgi:hypothetical protein